MSNATQKMLNKAQTEIVSYFLKNPFQKCTINELANALGRYHSEIRRALNSLEGIIDVKKIGTKTSECSINFSTANIDSLAYASIYNKMSVSRKIKIVAKEFEKNLSEDLFILVLFGSYAKVTAKTGSDIDLCFITQEDTEKLRLKAQAIAENFSYKLHINVFTVEEFYNMLWKRDTIGREVLNSSVILLGHDLYYRLVKRYDQEAGYSKSS